jgi:hypothetical protein
LWTEEVNRFRKRYQDALGKLDQATEEAYRKALEERKGLDVPFEL